MVTAYVTDSGRQHWLCGCFGLLLLSMAACMESNTPTSSSSKDFVPRIRADDMGFLAREGRARNRDREIYELWQDASTEDLISGLIELRGTSLFERSPTQFNSAPAINFRGIDPTFDLLLDRPEQLKALDLQSPTAYMETGYSYQDPTSRTICRSLKGFRRGLMDVYPMKLDSLHISNRKTVSCDVASTLIVREGVFQTPFGHDFLLFRPESEECRWLYLDGNIIYCAESLREWLLASIVGVSSQWSRLHLYENVVFEALTQPLRSNQDCLDELLSWPVQLSVLHIFSSSMGRDYRQLIAPHPNYVEVLQDFGRNRYPAILSEQETWQYNGAGRSPIHYWNGNFFERVRLRPSDYINAVVVVDSYTHVLQIFDDDRLIYLDEKDNRAFSTFNEWANYKRALVWHWAHYGRELEANSAGLPMG